jgi:hypothetical protein
MFNFVLVERPEREESDAVLNAHAVEASITGRRIRIFMVVECKKVNGWGTLTFLDTKYYVVL